MFNSPYNLSWSSARCCKKVAVFAFFLARLLRLFWGAGVAKTSLSVFLRTLFLVVGASSSELPPDDRNGNLPLLSSLTHFAARLFSVRTGGCCEVRQTGNASPGGVRGRRGAGCGVILFVLVQMVTSSGIPLFGWCVGGGVVQRPIPEVVTPLHGSSLLVRSLSAK